MELNFTIYSTLLDTHYKLTTNGNKLGFPFVVRADYFVSVCSKFQLVCSADNYKVCSAVCSA